MASGTRKVGGDNSVTAKVLQKIKSGNKQKVWRVLDFPNFSPRAVARALARLAAEGQIRRVRKGMYRKKVGEDLSDLDVLQVKLKDPLHPSRESAAHFLGFRQTKAKRATFATPAASAPETSAHVLLRRPRSRRKLDEKNGALLEFIRDRGNYSELSPDKTRKLLLFHLRENDTFTYLLPYVLSESPRARAIFAAAGEELGASKVQLYRLRRTLNPLSVFDFGKLSTLRYAKEWQAK
jgi:hypothetical protein